MPITWGSLPLLGIVAMDSSMGTGLSWASHGPKLSDASIPHVFPKPISKAEYRPYTKVGSRLDTMPNRPTTSTISRTRPLVACSACDPKGRPSYFEADMPPKLGETGNDRLERTLSRHLYPTSDPNDS
ncbi:hypothetical protein TNCV_1616491 [Trichonephila clavipes]|nr:hypothetical protein TNCV_1616491 [Trichonephila clavipes]